MKTESEVILLINDPEQEKNHYLDKIKQYSALIERLTLKIEALKWVLNIDNY